MAAAGPKLTGNPKVGNMMEEEELRGIKSSERAFHIYRIEMEIIMETWRRKKRVTESESEICVVWMDANSLSVSSLILVQWGRLYKRILMICC